MAHPEFDGYKHIGDTPLSKEMMAKVELSILRGIDPTTLKWVYGCSGYPFGTLITNGGLIVDVIPSTITRPIGIKDSEGRVIYEGDVYREEVWYEETDQDRTEYYVCTWIQELCCFGWLNAQEYIDYLELGITILDDCGVPFNCTYEPTIKIIGSIYTMPFEKILQYSSRYDSMFNVKVKKKDDSQEN